MLSRSKIAEVDQWCAYYLKATKEKLLQVIVAGIDADYAEYLNFYTEKDSIFLYAQAKSAGSIIFQRKFRLIPGQMAYSESIMIYPAYAKCGIGKILNRNLWTIMRRTGTSVLQARATTRAGSYFCARCGFVPARAEWKQYKIHLQKRYRDILELNPGINISNTFLNTLNSDNPDDMRAIFLRPDRDLKHPEWEHPITLARALFENRDMSWGAVLDLNNSDSLEWFKNTVGVLNDDIWRMHSE